MAMEHEVYVPLSPGTVRGAFADPHRVAGCVPGLQPEPGGGPGAVAGRLRLRIGSSTITYRGTATLTAEGEDFRVEAEGEETRGSGSVRVVLRMAVRAAPDGTGTLLAFAGAAEGSGRLGAAFTAEQRAAAARRLCERFAETLTEELARAAEPPPVVGGIGEPEDNERVIPGIPAASEPEEAASAGSGAQAAEPAGPADPVDPVDPVDSVDPVDPGDEAPSPRGPLPAAHEEEPAQDRLRPEDPAGGVERDIERDLAGEMSRDLPEDLPEDPVGERGRGRPPVPGGAGEPFPKGGVPDEFPADFLAEELADELVDEVQEELVAEGLEVEELVTAGADEPEPEADFARRTMIGRSAEEVDHAPPRGRYAPEPVPGSSPSSPRTLTWAVPAAAFAVASAVALARVWRRRRS